MLPTAQIGGVWKTLSSSNPTLQPQLMINQNGQTLSGTYTSTAGNGTITGQIMGNVIEWMSLGATQMCADASHISLKGQVDPSDSTKMTHNYDAQIQVCR